MKVNIWKLPRRVSERELEKRLSEYGRLFSFQFYGSYAIAEFRHRRDAERAIRKLNDSYFDGTRIRVDEYKPRDKVRGPTANDTCFNCSKKGHWANECREGDWS